VNLVKGNASLSIDSLSVGAHVITAEYGGDDGFKASVGKLSASHTINKADTATVIATSINPSVYGQSVVFTAVVKAVAPGAGTQTGLIQFNSKLTAHHLVLRFLWSMGVSVFPSIYSLPGYTSSRLNTAATDLTTIVRSTAERIIRQLHSYLCHKPPLRISLRK
jgi:hypothetical protein